MSIKAIQTPYSGYHFRSRLEARWAVFFNALDIPFRYELQGYNINGRNYLPDFYLVDIGTYIEVKPYPITEEGYALMRDLCVETNKQVVVVEGDPYMCSARLYAFNRWECDYTHTPQGLAELNDQSLRLCGEDFYSIEHLDEKGFCTSEKYTLGWLPVTCADGYGTWYNTRAERMGGGDRTTVITAMLKARQARFEYGETPQ